MCVLFSATAVSCLPIGTAIGQITDPLAQQESESAEVRAIRLFDAGKFDDAITLAKNINVELGTFSVEEKWTLMIVKAQMAKGEYEKAYESLHAEPKKFAKSIRMRWVGADVCRFNNKPDEATRYLKEISELASRNSWQYRDVPNRIILGKYFASLGADAKEVLTEILNPLKKRYPNKPEVFNAIGELALGKHDYAMAAENFQQALTLDPKNIEALFGVASAFRPSDTEKSVEAVESILAINPNHIDALLLLIDQHIAAERYGAAEKALDQVLAVNPAQPIAWSYRAVIAHLQNKPAKEGEYRKKALAHWQGNPNVDHTIGRELSEKYRFKEGEKYQRRAIVYDKNFLPAKMQLAHDLLRLGQELEGWKLADEVFNADQYSVVAHNLVTLRGEISEFTTLERDGFVVRMSKEEAVIYGERVLNLLTRAKASLCPKYESELETPIFVEIFPRQQDFAIRTFGLPGGAGFLGVCFGRVITMNSPAAQGANLTSWESVLWHEFCHVVTLQKTNNKMPRWLSEGISVYEEKLADQAWGDEMTATYRKMILGKDLTPVSELSGAFLRPPTPQHLQFAYYESCLVVEYLVQNFGLPSLKEVLVDLSTGTPVNDALRRHCAPVDFIDKKFEEFASDRANSFAPDANWDDLPTEPKASAAEWAKWNSDHVDNLNGLVAEASLWMADKEFSKAAERLKRVVEISPTSKQAYPMLAACYRQLNQPEEELEILEAMVTNEANSVELFTRLLEISSASNDWEKTKIYSRRLLGVNPLITAPHRYLSIAAEKTKDDEAAIEALSVLANLDPLDAADIHFRLASALHRTKQLGEAKRQVILSLEQAPRYRDAHALLLKIVREQSGKSSEFNDDSPVESVDSKDSDSIGSDELDSKKELP